MECLPKSGQIMRNLLGARDSVIEPLLEVF
jgi:hypothetical protein